MNPLIEPTAQISPSAQIGFGAVIGAHAVIGPHCVIEPYAIIGHYTTLGEGCRVSSFASVGCAAQDRSTPPDAPTQLIAGRDNQFREGCTISRGSIKGAGITRIGDQCLFMAQSHVGHDSQLGSQVTLANGVALAGHCQIGDQVTLGGYAGVHQFVRIGRLAFVAAHAMVSQDIPPFSLAAGDRARLLGLNHKGLERALWSSETMREVRIAWRKILLGSQRRALAEGYLGSPIPEIDELARFILQDGRGLARIQHDYDELEEEDS